MSLFNYRYWLVTTCFTGRGGEGQGPPLSCDAAGIPAHPSLLKIPMRGKSQVPSWTLLSHFHQPSCVTVNYWIREFRGTKPLTASVNDARPPDHSGWVCWSSLIPAEIKDVNLPPLGSQPNKGNVGWKRLQKCLINSFSKRFSPSKPFQHTQGGNNTPNHRFLHPHLSHAKTCLIPSLLLVTQRLQIFHVHKYSNQHPSYKKASSFLFPHFSHRADLSKRVPWRVKAVSAHLRHPESLVRLSITSLSWI